MTYTWNSDYENDPTLAGAASDFSCFLMFLDAYYERLYALGIIAPGTGPVPVNVHQHFNRTTTPSIFIIPGNLSFVIANYWLQLIQGVYALREYFVDEAALGTGPITFVPGLCKTPVNDVTDSFPGPNGFRRKFKREIWSTSCKGENGWRAVFRVFRSFGPNNGLAPGPAFTYTWQSVNRQTPDAQRSNQGQLYDYKNGAWVLSDDQDTPPDFVIDYGLPQQGDYIAGHLLNDLQLAINLMQTPIGEHLLYDGDAQFKPQSQMVAPNDYPAPAAVPFETSRIGWTAGNPNLRTSFGVRITTSMYAPTGGGSLSDYVQRPFVSGNSWILSMLAYANGIAGGTQADEQFMRDVGVGTLVDKPPPYVGPAEFGPRDTPGQHTVKASWQGSSQVGVAFNLFAAGFCRNTVSTYARVGSADWNPWTEQIVLAKSYAASAWRNDFAAKRKLRVFVRAIAYPGGFGASPASFNDFGEGYVENKYIEMPAGPKGDTLAAGDPSMKNFRRELVPDIAMGQKTAPPASHADGGYYLDDVIVLASFNVEGGFRYRPA